MHIRINEALKGKDKTELAKLLWPGKSPNNQYQNMRLLLNGKKQNYSYEMINTIADYCNVTPNFLFNGKQKLPS